MKVEGCLIVQAVFSGPPTRDNRLTDKRVRARMSDAPSVCTSRTFRQRPAEPLLRIYTQLRRSYPVP
eukprot:4607203-Pyramimonas_sp.AAC.1